VLDYDDEVAPTWGVGRRVQMSIASHLMPHAPCRRPILPGTACVFRGSCLPWITTSAPTTIQRQQVR
jgi:hypothetical protein